MYFKFFQIIFAFGAFGISFISSIIKMSLYAFHDKMFLKPISWHNYSYEKTDADADVDTAVLEICKLSKIYQEVKY